MQYFCFTDLCKKEVISIDCGKKLGFPRDVQIDKCGQIKFLILPCKSTFSLFSGKDCVKVPWRNVERIGDDIIWVCGDFNKKDDCFYDKDNKRGKDCCD